MVSFLCDCCNYKTDIKCNFVRHLKSFKHIKKSEFYGVKKNYKNLLNFKTQKDPKKTQKDPKRPKKTQLIFQIMSNLNPNPNLKSNLNLYATIVNPHFHHLPIKEDMNYIVVNKIYLLQTN